MLKVNLIDILLYNISLYAICCFEPDTFEPVQPIAIGTVIFSTLSALKTDMGISLLQPVR